MNFPSSTVRVRLPSPLGDIIAAATDRGLCGLWFDGQRHQPDAEVMARWPEAANHPLLHQAAQALTAYFEGEADDFDLPLDLHGGTAFQQAVWRALLQIPRGETVSYGLLSQRVGNPAAVRAVGAAVGRNPVSIVVPCHRVVGGNGSLTGYAGGLERKAALLKLEKALAETEGLFA
ncbi:cysteine methyltransferase [Rhodoferax koreense]|uniref:Methylated-DNA--protein-cysteine methyltransferase n=1 Tax=Rhodoferax koreensis TaxID=1842727 RepID=A0A1P8JWW0_9BURK|nr:methylated-DNA--[protein]-cysteine S-methyltransferase [Rhodoferax koreense]APW38242.1 cysteine methyltransferase [Rhodoferax koreense]